jgi:signal transduction histidine kinase
MTSLVENLLSLARADGGAETVTLAPIRINLLFSQVAGTWEKAMDQALLDFRVEMPGDDLIVLGDAHGIPRLLSILLENASKYTPPGGLVKLNANADGQRIILSVHDTGVGIDPAHIVRIFDRFYRATPAGWAVPAGSGLGLSLGKWIAERHGTELSVESEPGRGSIFSFSLERTDATVPAINVSSAPRTESEARLVRPSSCTL